VLTQVIGEDLVVVFLTMIEEEEVVVDEVGEISTVERVEKAVLAQEEGI